MISKLIIKNFQSHKLTKLKFHSGVNCIIGSSDVGKTAIIRALRWLMFNRPKGDAIRSYWGGETRVSMSTEAGKLDLVRDSTNYYVLNGQKLEAIGYDVPEEVTSMLNVNEINLQNQHDRPFLLDTSPGAVAQFFNAVAHLDVIDRAISNVQKWIRELHQGIDSAASQIVNLEAKLSEYDGIEELDGRVTAIEQLDKERRGYLSLAEQLQTYVKEIKDVEAKIDSHASILNLDESVDATLLLIQEKQNKTVEQIQLLNLLTAIEDVNKQAESKQNLISKLEAQFVKMFPDVCPLCNAPKSKNLVA